jgi:hypothetical protein
MSAPLPLDERLEVAAQLIKRARIFYDIWWFYEGADTRPALLDTMDEYSEFFRFDSHAHFVAFVVYLAGLLETRSDTVNLRALLQEAKDSGVVAPDEIAKAEAALSWACGLVPKVAILRNNLFSHRSAKLSYKEVFEKASITPNQLRDLTDAGLRVTNILLTARGLQERSFHDLPKAHTQALFNDLAKFLRLNPFVAPTPASGHGCCSTLG